MTDSIIAGVGWIAAAIALGLIGFYLLRRFRDGDADGQQSTSDLISNFRELHLQGELNDEEYRTIKTRLSERLQQELKDAGKDV